MKNYKSGHFAFSLIELLVVIAIIGIIASVAAPVYKDYTVKAKLNKVMPFVEDLFAKQKQYWATKGTFPGPAESAKMYGTTNSGNNFVARVNPYVSNVYTYAIASGCGSTFSLTLDTQALGISNIAASGSINCYQFNISGVIYTTCNYALQDSGGAYLTADYIPQWFGCKDTTCSNPNTYYQVKDGSGGKYGFVSANCIN